VSRAARTALLASALSLALAAPAPAGAAKPTGNTTLVVDRSKAALLEQRGVVLSGVGGAQTAGRETRLQVKGGEIGDTAAAFAHRGGLRLTAGAGRSRREIVLRGLRVQLGNRSVLSAKLGSRRLVVFRLAARPGRLDLNPTAGTAQLLGARLIWRPGAVAALSRKLGRRIPRGALGKLRTKAAKTLDEVPKPAAIPPEPPLLARPAGAVDVTGGSLTWHVRDSWIRYVSSSTAPETQGGATANPAYPGNEHPCPDNPVATNPTLTYSYDFPFSNGWYDPASGTTALYHGGGVRFSYPSRGIDLATRNPEIEIAGAASRAIFRLKGAGGTAYPDSRAAIMSLAAGTPAVESPAGTFTYTAPVKATLTPDGEAVFGGFYSPPNNGFGCFSISFTTG